MRGDHGRQNKGDDCQDQKGTHLGKARQSRW
jgi:hypothetical protein